MPRRVPVFLDSGVDEGTQLSNRGRLKVKRNAQKSRLSRREAEKAGSQLPGPSLAFPLGEGVKFSQPYSGGHVFPTYFGYAGFQHPTQAVVMAHAIVQNKPALNGTVNERDLENNGKIAQLALPRPSTSGAGLNEVGDRIARPDSQRTTGTEAGEVLNEPKQLGLDSKVTGTMSDNARANVVSEQGKNMDIPQQGSVKSSSQREDKEEEDGKDGDTQGNMQAVETASQEHINSAQVVVDVDVASGNKDNEQAVPMSAVAAGTADCPSQTIAEQHEQRPLRMKDLVRTKMATEVPEIVPVVAAPGPQVEKVGEGETGKSGNGKSLVMPGEDKPPKKKRRTNAVGGSGRPETSASSRVPAKNLSPEARLQRIRNLSLEIKKADKVIARLRKAKMNLEAEVEGTRAVLAAKPLLDKYKRVTELCAANELPDVLTLLADALLEGSLPMASIRFHRLVSLAINCNKVYTNQLQYSDAEMRYFSTLRKQSCAAAVLEAMRGPMNVGEGHGKHSLRTAKITEFVPSLKALERYEKQTMKEKEQEVGAPSMRTAEGDAPESGCVESGGGDTLEVGGPGGLLPEPRAASSAGALQGDVGLTPVSSVSPPMKPGKAAKLHGKRASKKDTNCSLVKARERKAKQPRAPREGKKCRMGHEDEVHFGQYEGQEVSSLQQTLEEQQVRQQQLALQAQAHAQHSQQQELEHRQYEQQLQQHARALAQIQAQNHVQVAHSPQPDLPYEHQVPLDPAEPHLQQARSQMHPYDHISYSQPTPPHTQPQSHHQHSPVPSSDLEEIHLPELDPQLLGPSACRSHHRSHTLGGQLSETMPRPRQQYEDPRSTTWAHPPETHQSRSLDYPSPARWPDPRMPHVPPLPCSMPDRDTAYLQAQPRGHLEHLEPYGASVAGHESEAAYREHLRGHHVLPVDSRLQALQYDPTHSLPARHSPLSLSQQPRSFSHPIESDTQEQNSSSYVRMHSSLDNARQYETSQVREDMASLQHPYMRPPSAPSPQHYALGPVPSGPDHELADRQPHGRFSPYMGTDHLGYGRYLPDAQ